MVDDDAAVRNALKFALEVEGLDVSCSMTAPVSLLSDPNPASLWLPRHRLPHAGHGRAGADRRAARPRHRGRLRILVTGRANKQLRAQAEKLGVHCLIEKPLSDNALLDSIRAALGQSALDFGNAMPRTIMGYVLAFTAVHQAGLALLSIAVFGLSAVPLELQRRIVNGLTTKTGVETIFWLAVGYAGVALAEQSLKLTLNVYRGWVAESSVRRLRHRICAIAPGPHTDPAQGSRRGDRDDPGRGRADRRIHGHQRLRAAVAGRHPGQRRRLHVRAAAAACAAGAGLLPASDGVRAPCCSAPSIAAPVLAS